MKESLNVHIPQQGFDATPINTAMPSTRPWESSSFEAEEQDPLTGFANIMDVMLVFALGLMVALLSLEEAEKTNVEHQPNKIEITSGEELIDVPESLKNAAQADGNGMESVGQVYRDPKTGKLILIGQ